MHLQRWRRPLRVVAPLTESQPPALQLLARCKALANRRCHCVAALVLRLSHRLFSLLSWSFCFLGLGLALNDAVIISDRDLVGLASLLVGARLGLGKERARENCAILRLDKVAFDPELAAGRVDGLGHGLFVFLVWG